MHGNFTWVDLSTYDLEQAKAFYGTVLGWNTGYEQEGYVTATVGMLMSPNAGIYRMPAFFESINMPSFWMSYLAVDDVEATVAKAKELGAKIELEETNAMGRIALIRDPLGAGFTCFQGTAKSSRGSFGKHGRWCWNELYVSALEPATTFYRDLLGWRFEAESETRLKVFNARDEEISAFEKAGDELRGNKEYWAVYFACRDIQKASKQIVAGGGEIFLPENDLGILGATDPSGATFFLRQIT